MARSSPAMTARANDDECAVDNRKVHCMIRSTNNFPLGGTLATSQLSLSRNCYSHFVTQTEAQTQLCQLKSNTQFLKHFSDLCHNAGTCTGQSPNCCQAMELTQRLGEPYLRARRTTLDLSVDRTHLIAALLRERQRCRTGMRNVASEPSRLAAEVQSRGVVKMSFRPSNALLLQHDGRCDVAATHLL